MTDDFDDLLRQLDSEEQERKRVSIENINEQIRAEAAMASANYDDWLRHYELLNSQFREAHELFGRIEKSVTNWSRWVVYDTYFKKSSGMLEFSTGLQFYDRFDSERRTILTVSLPKITDVSIRKPDELGPAELNAPEHRILGVLQQRRKIKDDLVSWVNELSRVSLEVGLYKGDDEAPLAKRNAGIGYLYSHSLAEACKRVFMMINDPHIPTSSWGAKLEQIIPGGDYSIRRGNLVSHLADDNTITPDQDPEWRNG
jgi:hypothetical protein